MTSDQSDGADGETLTMGLQQSGDTMPRYEGSIWRPPSEANSLILQATIGCSHNACTFCVSYKDRKYRVRGVEGIRSDLQFLPYNYRQSVKRVFLADGNALAMSTAELVEVLGILRRELPTLERVGAYGYARNVRSKSIEELGAIHEAGLGIVYLGLETGDDELLRWVRKGVDSAENISACLKMKDAGVVLSLTIILGLGGQERSEHHACKTAKVLNEIDPEYVGALTLMTPPGTAIHQMVASGEFRPLPPMSILRELRVLVENLELTDCVFRTNHASNYLATGGSLPRDKSRLLTVIDRALQSDDESVLRPSYLRGL